MPQKTYLQYVLDKAYLQRIPVSGTFELTARCNLNCPMCYIHKAENDPVARAKELPTDFWLELLEQVRAAGALTLLITGGEPTLHPGFRKIYTAAKEAGLILTLNSNGTMFTQEDVSFFAAYPPARINISLYGVSEETYETQCGVGAMYRRVTENIRALRRQGINVNLNLTVTARNQQDVPAIYDFARQVGASVHYTTYMFPPLRAEENGGCSAERVCPEEAARLSMICDREKFSPEEFAQRKAAFDADLPVALGEDGDELRTPTERIFCRAGSSAWWVTFDGRLTPCGMLTKPVVDLKNQTFSAAWEELRRQTDKIFLPAACTSCSLRKYCQVCAAVCFSENGRFDAVPDYMCEKTRAYVKAMREAT